MSTVIGSGRQEIWDTLTAPDRRTRWGPLSFLSLDDSGPYPAPGHPVRWRCRLGRIPVELRETPLVVSPSEQFRAALALGGLRLEQTFTLSPEPGRNPATRLHVKLVAPNRAPVVGGLMDRFLVRELVTDLAGGVLEAVQEALEAADRRAGQRLSRPPPRRSPGRSGAAPRDRRAEC